MATVTGTVGRRDARGRVWTLVTVDGQRYELTGDLGQLRDGMRVELTGNVVRDQMGFRDSTLRFAVRSVRVL